MKEPGPVLAGTLVFLGSGAGGLLRYFLGDLVKNWHNANFPTGTLFVNVSGCLVMGLCVGAWSGATPMREDVRLALLIGVLGGYTTFSSFGRDFYVLALEGAWLKALLYAATSVVLSLLCVWIGAAAASRFIASPA
ncbi:MAG: fluoride efflux transporter CrcB [Phycisphaerales bacterium]|nr:fluoride efflux transporter CrcB [Planctomycetota bacterium]